MTQLDEIIAMEELDADQIQMIQWHVRESHSVYMVAILLCVSTLSLSTITHPCACDTVQFAKTAVWYIMLGSTSLKTAAFNMKMPVHWAIVLESNIMLVCYTLVFHMTDWSLKDYVSVYF